MSSMCWRMECRSGSVVAQTWPHQTLRGGRRQWIFSQNQLVLEIMQVAMFVTVYESMEWLQSAMDWLPTVASFPLLPHFWILSGKIAGAGVGEMEKVSVLTLSKGTRKERYVSLPSRIIAWFTSWRMILSDLVRMDPRINRWKSRLFFVRHPISCYFDLQTATKPPAPTLQPSRTWRVRRSSASPVKISHNCVGVAWRRRKRARMCWATFLGMRIAWFWSRQARKWVWSWRQAKCWRLMDFRCVILALQYLCCNLHYFLLASIFVYQLTLCRFELFRSLAGNCLRTNRLPINSQFSLQIVWWWVWRHTRLLVGPNTLTMPLEWARLAPVLRIRFVALVSAHVLSLCLQFIFVCRKFTRNVDSLLLLLLRKPNVWWSTMVLVRMVIAAFHHFLVCCLSSTPLVWSWLITSPCHSYRVIVVA